VCIYIYIYIYIERERERERERKSIILQYGHEEYRGLFIINKHSSLTKHTAAGGSGVKGCAMIDNISSDDATASFPETDICAVEYSSGDSI